MLSNTSKYALRAVIYIAAKSTGEKKIGIKVIAKELEIPMPFLGKVLQSLAKHKLLISTKGPNGGFGLAKEPSKIKLIEIVEIIDGLDIFNECILGNKYCDHHHNICPVHERYSEIRLQFYDLFKKTTLKQLMHDIDNNEKPNILL